VLARYLRSWLKRDKPMSSNPDIAENDIFMQNPFEMELLISTVVIVWLTPAQVTDAEARLILCLSSDTEVDQDWVSDSETKIGLARIGSFVLGTLFIPIFLLVVYNKLHHALANNLVWIATCIWMAVMFTWTIIYR